MSDFVAQGFIPVTMYPCTPMPSACPMLRLLFRPKAFIIPISFVPMALTFAWRLILPRG